MGWQRCAAAAFEAMVPQNMAAPARVCVRFRVGIGIGDRVRVIGWRSDVP